MRKGEWFCYEARQIGGVEGGHKNKAAAQVSQSVHVVLCFSIQAGHECSMLRSTKSERARSNEKRLGSATE